MPRQIGSVSKSFELQVLTFSLVVLVVLLNARVKDQPKRHQPPPDVAQPVGGVPQALVEAEVFGNGPDGRARPAHMPGEEGARRRDVARNGLLAEDVLACRQGAADDARLHGDGETDDDGGYVSAGQEMVERGFLRAGGVMVDGWPGLDCSRDGGGCLFGSRVHGSQGERWGVPDGWYIFCHAALAFSLEERTEKMVWVFGNGQREEGLKCKGLGWPLRVHVRSRANMPPPSSATAIIVVEPMRDKSSESWQWPLRVRP